jgi:hypothetical protein
MPEVRKRLLRPVATRGQMFRAISLAAAFAVVLAWTLKDTPAGAAPTAPQIVAAQ